MRSKTRSPTGERHESESHLQEDLMDRDEEGEDLTIGDVSQFLDRL